MSDENRFFRFLRRFNTLLLTVVGLGFLVLQGNLLLEHFDIQIPGVNQRPVFVPTPSKVDYAYLLNPVVTLGIGSERLDALKRVSSVEGIAYNTIPGTDVNILATDRKTGTSHWLFQGRERTILAISDVVSEGGEGAGGKTGIAMVVAEKDTNHDGEIGADDKVSLYVYFKDGKAPVKVLTADRIMPGREIPVANWIVFYQEGKATYVATYSLPGLKLLTKHSIPDMPKIAVPPKIVNAVGGC